MKKYLYCTVLGMLVFSAAFGIDEGDQAEPQQDDAVPITFQVILETVQKLENETQVLEDLLARKAAVAKPEVDLLSLKDQIQRLKKLATDGVMYKALAQGDDFTGTPEQRREFAKQVDDYEKVVLGNFQEHAQSIHGLMSIMAIMVGSRQS